jgi:D-threo-aldose 1-dehydrogenase
MSVDTIRALGRTGVEVTRLALGCAPLGGLFQSVSDVEARRTVEAAWEAGVRSFDVAPQYGLGRAEQRLGEALRRYARAQYVVSTKVGRLIVPRGEGDEGTGIFADAPPVELAFDYSRDGVRRSLEASLERLGLDRVDVVHVHDPDDHLDQAIAEAVPALCALRDEGLIGAVGAGMNYAAPLDRIVRESDVDCVLLAGRYTLLDNESALGLLETCDARGVSVIAAGVFNSGVLADPRPGATFDYRPAPGHVLARARAIRWVCDTTGVPLATAAMRFPFGHPAVHSVLVGARSAAEVQENAAGFSADVPPALWDALRAASLLAPGVPTPG